MEHCRRNTEFKLGHFFALMLLSLSICNGCSVCEEFQRAWAIKAEDWQHVRGDTTEVRTVHSSTTTFSLHTSCNLGTHDCFLWIVLRSVYALAIDCPSIDCDHLLHQCLRFSSPAKNGAFQRNDGHLDHVFDHLFHRIHSQSLKTKRAWLLEHSLDMPSLHR